MDVTPDIFLAAKAQIQLDSPDAKRLAEKMKDIVERYKCFVEEEILQIKQAAPPRSRAQHHHNYTRTHQHITHNTPRPKILCTSSHSAVIGLLNKITVSNYERIKTKLIRYYSFQDSLELSNIIKLILCKTFTHVVYKKIYEALIHEFFKTYPSEVTNVVNAFITEFVSGLSKNLQEFMVDYDPQQQYDEYCIQNKAKDQLLAQFQVVVMFDHVFLKAKYNLEIMDAINVALFNIPNNTYIFSICTDFIKLFLAQYGIPQKDTVIYDNIIHVNESIYQHSPIPKRLQFAWEEILRMLPS